MTTEGDNTILDGAGEAGGDGGVEETGSTLLGSTPEGEPSADNVKGETGSSDEPEATEGDGPKGEGENAGEEGEGEEGNEPAELKLEVPEGLDVPEDRLERFKAFATEKGLSQEHAQAILDNALELNLI